MNSLQDIFKILHQPVQLLIAALMFAYKEPKRKFWLIRAVLAAILGFLVLEFCITASPEIRVVVGKSGSRSTMQGKS